MAQRVKGCRKIPRLCEKMKFVARNRQYPHGTFPSVLALRHLVNRPEFEHLYNVPCSFVGPDVAADLRIRKGETLVGLVQKLVQKFFFLVSFLHGREVQSQPVLPLNLHKVN